jgi:hypothetical protein
MVEVEIEFKLLPTISRPVYLGVGFPSGAHDQVFYSVYCRFLYVGALSDERTHL